MCLCLIAASEGRGVGDNGELKLVHKTGLTVGHEATTEQEPIRTVALVTGEKNEPLISVSFKKVTC